jgi:hypothetical protein
MLRHKLRILRAYADDNREQAPDFIARVWIYSFPSLKLYSNLVQCQVLSAPSQDLRPVLFCMSDLV